MSRIIKALRFLPAFFILWFVIDSTLCYSQPDSKIAVLFIHGLSGDHATWKEVIEDLSSDAGFFEGNFQPNHETGLCKFTKSDLPTQAGAQKQISDLHLFTLDFSSNQNLSFEQQGDEMHIIINEIRSTLGINRIILVGHSMGGLAARAYLMKYGSQDIIGLVTAATPHLGSFLGYSKDIIDGSLDNSRLAVASYLLDVSGSQLSATASAELIRAAVFSKIGLDIYSKAMDYLKPDSPEMQKLYNQVLPVDLPIAIIQSEWNPGLSIKKPPLDILAALGNWAFKLTRDKTPIDLYPYQLQQQYSDGVVTLPSQDIRISAFNGNQLHPIYFKTDKFHTEVPEDIKVIRNAIFSLLNPIPDKGANQGFSLGFIIDSSGSMEESDPNDIRKSGIIQLLNYIDNKDDVFVVDFDNNATFINEDNYRNWDKGKLIEAIKHINSDGGTSIGGGLRKMKEVLEKNLTSNGKCFIILLSDGKGDYADEADWFAQRGIKVYTISYMDFADGILLNKIAIGTGGIYVKVINELNIIMAYLQFINECKDQSWICSYSSRIIQGQRITVPFYLEKGTGKINLLVSWIGSRIDYKLIAPDGTTFDPSSSQSSIGGHNYRTFKLDNPQAGKWMAIVQGTEIPTGGEEFVLNVSSDNKNEFILEHGTLENGTIHFNFVNNQLFKDLNVKTSVLLRTPANTVFDISSSFRDGQISILPVYGMGDYTATVDLTMTNQGGNVIQRHYERSFSTITESGAYGIISSIQGNYIKAAIGQNVGNRPGIFCYFYDRSIKDEIKKAKGLVTYVSESECQIEIQEFYQNYYFIAPGDLLKLDVIQWQNDRVK